MLAGLLAAGAVERGLDRERAERQQVPAVVTKDAVDATPPTRQVGTPQAWTTVRWRTSDGSTHTDRTRVPPGTRAGTRITVWTDRHGNLASQPLAAADAVFRATVIGGLVAIGTGLTVWGSGRIVCGCLPVPVSPAAVGRGVGTHRHAVGREDRLNGRPRVRSGRPAAAGTAWPPAVSGVRQDRARRSSRARATAGFLPCRHNAAPTAVRAAPLWQRTAHRSREVVDHADTAA
ncbi:Rv1733c family protein [Streptomyces chiangmaiensis]|uniref:Rv1733c family protein n=1 Tax=Streptomyces chiangmaiensis TaxID=766497 RepID=UPI003CD0B525